MRFLIFLLSLLTLSSAQAGFVELFNGDRLEGDFVRLDGDRLVWATQNFGEVRILRSNIRNIQTTMPMKISGSSTPCMLEGMMREYLFYTCGGDSNQRSVPLSTLDIMTPFESYIEGDYTFTGRFALSGFIAKGNETREDLRVRTQMEYRRSEFRHAAFFEYASLSTNKRSADDVWQARYTLDWFLRERWFWSNDLSAGGDETRAIDSYYNIGSGTGYQFWENTKTALSTTAGFTYLNERFEVPEVIPDNFERVNERMAARLGMNFRYQLPLGIAFFHKSELFRSLDDSGDWRLTSGSGLTTMIVGALRSEFKIDYNVNNQPQPGKRREDTRMTVGISYDW